jgi:hypothetical protein
MVQVIDGGGDACLRDARTRTIRSMRRRLRSLLLAALLGSLTMYLVAWTFAWRGQPDPAQTQAFTYAVAQPGTRITRGQAGMRRVSGVGFATLVAESSFDANADELDEQHRSLEALRSGAGMHAWFVSGWPLPSVACEYCREDGTTGGMLITDEVNTNFGGAAGVIPRAFAWRPLWPGAVVNAAIFAVAWWLLLVVPTALRQRRRRRGGRCAACGYDLRATADSRCPECGSISA